MTGMLEFDEDAARRVEAAYTKADIVEQRAGVTAAMGLLPGEAVLDVGVGPGFLAAEIAAAVGSEGRVCGVDISADMLTLARGRSVGSGAAPLELQLAGVETLPYPNGTFDAVVSTQVLEYVPDIPGALDEIHRVLRPGGRALILDTDWDSLVWAAPDEALMERVVTAWEAHLAHPHLPRTLGRQLSAAGFVAGPPTVVPLLNIGDPGHSFSGNLLGLVATFVTGRNGLDAETVAAWEASMRSLGDDWFFSLNRYVFLAHRS